LRCTVRWIGAGGAAAQSATSAPVTLIAQVTASGGAGGGQGQNTGNQGAAAALAVRLVGVTWTSPGGSQAQCRAFSCAGCGRRGAGAHDGDGLGDLAAGDHAVRTSRSHRWPAGSADDGANRAGLGAVLQRLASVLHFGAPRSDRARLHVATARTCDAILSRLCCNAGGRRFGLSGRATTSSCRPALAFRLYPTGYSPQPSRVLTRPFCFFGKQFH
jgi:hypothetical protein